MRFLQLIFGIIFLQTDVVHGNIDGYVDPTFNCPAVTTCPVVCMAEGEQCPESLICPSGENVCWDGSCSDECANVDEIDDDTFNPTTNSTCPDCRPIICPKIVLPYSTCLSDFGEYYDKTTTCIDEEEEETTQLFTLRESGFVVVYCWVCISFALMIGWCAFNQRLSPVPGSTRSITTTTTTTDDVKKNEHDKETTTGWNVTQTGYRTSFVGTFIYAIVVITLIGFQCVMITLTIYYYVQQEAIEWTPMIFEDEIQVLTVFQITWWVAFIYTLLLKWPISVRSLFYRRSTLVNATHVAVISPMQKMREATQSTSTLEYMKSVLITVGKYITATMRFIFSDMTPLPDSDGLSLETTVCPIKTDVDGTTKFFVFHMRRYNFDEESGIFAAKNCSIGSTIDDFLSVSKGLTTQQVEKRLATIGRNVIHMKKPTVFNCLIEEFSKPFYIYQLFMIWTWFPLWYFYMAFVQSIIVSSGGLVMTFFQYRNEANLYRLTYTEGSVTAMRDGRLVEIDHKDIVPGDIIAVSPGLLHGDMVLINGNEHVLVDESSLTGESTPMVKISFDVAERTSKYNNITHKKHTLSAGTRVLEAGTGSLALVLSTGSYTFKGGFLRDILNYNRHEFKFDTEVKIVLMILFIYGIFGFSITVHLYQDNFAYEFFYGMFVFATCLPPLLPTVFTVSVGISDDRLARKNIACVNSEDILVAGKVERVFFDKTGTLTKQGLEFTGDKPSGELALAMSICHNLTVSKNGDIIGNAVDRNMFAETGATFSGNTVELANGVKVQVLKNFDFDHHRMTQSVIVEYDEKTFIFVKGGGESIKKLCRTNTVPQDFDKTLENCAKKGIYQISFACKELVDVPKNLTSSIHRDTVESDLKFIGVVDFKNKLRDQTPAVIAELEKGDVQNAMITGDNTLTGICIAREANMIKSNERVIFGKYIDSAGSIVWVDEEGDVSSRPTIDSIKVDNVVIAVTGEVYRSIIEKVETDYTDLVEYIRIVGRATPKDKVLVVDTFVNLGITCCMVGDGGNDCGALKAAHIGIALSDSEASIVAPFTSLDKDITAVVEVLKEGRCALANALASYKYMIMYGMVETINQIVAAYYSVTFADWSWVFMDGIWMLSMAFTLPLSKAQKILSPTRPTSSLLGPHTLASVLGVLILNFTFTCIALAVLNGQPWYDCRRWASTDISNILVISDNYETSTLFIVTGYQYISSAMAYNFGYSFRAAWWKNYVFVVLCIFYTIMHFTATLYPSKFSCIWRLNCSNENIVRGVTDAPMPINNAFNTTIMPMDFRIKLIVIVIFNTLAIVLWEYFVVNGSFFSRKFASVPEKAKDDTKKTEGTNESRIGLDSKESSYGSA